MSAQRPAVSTLLIVGLLATSGLAQVITVDNVDSGFSVLTGEWNTGSYPTPNGADYRWVETTGEPFSEVEWRPNLPATDIYEVAVWRAPRLPSSGRLSHRTMP